MNSTELTSACRCGACMVNGKWMTEIAECVSTLSVPILIDKSARKLHRQLGSHCMLSDCFLQALICTTHIFHILYNNDESDGKSDGFGVQWLKDVTAVNSERNERETNACLVPGNHVHHIVSAQLPLISFNAPRTACSKPYGPHT
jgi:hypothetical protein